METVTGKTCGICKFSDLSELDKNMQRTLKCKFGPPETTPIVTSQGITFVTGYTDVTGMDPCHQWLSKEPANIKGLH